MAPHWPPAETEKWHRLGRILRYSIFCALHLHTLYEGSTAAVLLTGFCMQTSIIEFLLVCHVEHFNHFLFSAIKEEAGRIRCKDFIELF